jgi:hypothetical protein
MSIYAEPKLFVLMGTVFRTAQVETNDPTWRKAIEFIHPRAVSMASKPRYWAIAFPLVVTSLCVAPQDFFLKNWWTCVEGCLAKLKVCCYMSITKYTDERDLRKKVSASSS